ncbi:MAG: Bax inhibitor-1/YccA family protein [Minisyncoccia bacterium]
MTTSNDGLVGFIRGTYAWMCIGLLVTAAAALIVAITPGLTDFFDGNILVFYILIFLQIVAMFYLSIAAQKVSAASAGMVFLLYAVLNGITLSLIFLVYTDSSIVLAFLVAAAMFGIMSIYGYFTKMDLTAVGNIAGMALVGIILASVVNLFFANDTIYWITTYAGVLIFVGLTAYDTQKLKQLYLVGESTADGERKEAIVGALTLYLDVINLFLDFLRIFGKRRN